MIPFSVVVVHNSSSRKENRMKGQKETTTKSKAKEFHWCERLDSFASQCHQLFAWHKHGEAEELKQRKFRSIWSSREGFVEAAAIMLMTNEEDKQRGWRKNRNPTHFYHLKRLEREDYARWRMSKSHPIWLSTDFRFNHRKIVSLNYECHFHANRVNRVIFNQNFWKVNNCASRGFPMYELIRLYDSKFESFCKYFRHQNKMKLNPMNQQNSAKSIHPSCGFFHSTVYRPISALARNFRWVEIILMRKLTWPQSVA